MGAQLPLTVLSTGMVSSVGLSAPAACAAIRAGLTNPCETRFTDSTGKWITGHVVPLRKPWSGPARLAHMAAQVIEECLAPVPRGEWGAIPLLLCLAEPSRPGRSPGLDEHLFGQIRKLVRADFARESLIVSCGRVSIGTALLHARKLIYESDRSSVLIVGTDSLLSAPCLRALATQDRLLTEQNTNGFIPGEAAAAVLVGKCADGPHLRVEGLGFATESAHIDSNMPLRAEGLSRAIRAALADADCSFEDLDLRIADLSGEQYYFKEAALALSRTLRQRKDEFDIWHPAECIGEAGSAIGPVMLTVASAAYKKAYGIGRGALVHSSSDGGQRLAIVIRSGLSSGR